MATERKNTALEFETMLRRHLKSGGAPVTACAGFDFDAASAYLEEALGGSQRTGYESHLAGCAVCRRHLIELSRLAQTVPHAGTKPAPVLDQNPAWVRWREVVAGWFDLSTWNLKWQMLGAAGVAFAILIAALGVQSWRQASKADNLAVASTADAPTASTEPAQMLQMPTPDPSPQGEQDSSTAESATVHPDRSRASLPAPPVRPQAGDLPDAPVEPSKELLTLNTFQPGAPPSLDSNLRRIQAPAGDRQNAVAALQNLAPQQGGAALLDSSDNADKPALAMANPGGSGRVSRELAANSAAQAESNKIRNDITARITPPPGTNPMNSEPKPTPPRGKPQPEKSAAPSRLYEIASRLIPGSKSGSKKDSGQKAEPEPLNDESFKTLKVRIRDKVFRFNPDLKMWIDEEYKDEMLWRVTTLKRDSAGYEQVLAKNPLLKEFFDRGPILVIWKDKIYRVR